MYYQVQANHKYCAEVNVASQVLQKRAEEDGFRHSYITEALREIYATCRQWLWKGYSINYAVQGSGPPILLVHGFGASIGHWRRCGIKFQYS